MPLNNKQIAARLGMIANFVPEKTRTLNGMAVPSFGLGSMGYDLRLAVGSLMEVNINRAAGYRYLKPNDPNSYTLTKVQPDTETGEMVLWPDRLYLGSTVERFSIPKDVIAFFIGKSTYARLGLCTYMTPGEPGWDGHLTLEFTVTMETEVIENAGICQVVFFQGEETTAPYIGKYQNQAAEAVGAMVGHDEIVVKWEYVSSNCDWVAMDKNKKWHQYTQKPFADSLYWAMDQENGEYFSLPDRVVTLPSSFDWTQTLRRRPQ